MWNLPNKKYQIIYADPPWMYDSQTCVGKKSAITKKLCYHYKGLSFDDIKSIPVADIADRDCLLFLWVVSPSLQDCIGIINAWGFKYSTIGFVWDKVRPTSGNYTLPQCEICLIGKRGKIPKPRGARNIRQLITSKKTKHSKKPNEARIAIEKMFPLQEKIELFAREKYESWDSWGDQLNIGEKNE